MNQMNESNRTQGSNSGVSGDGGGPGKGDLLRNDLARVPRTS
jgi:hypothetical protein